MNSLFYVLISVLIKTNPGGLFIRRYQDTTAIVSDDSLAPRRYLDHRNDDIVEHQSENDAFWDHDLTLT